MSINLSNSTPAAPAGSTNVTWQNDVSGNVSAYITSAAELTGDGFDATAQGANIGTTDLVATPVAGVYRISAYIIRTVIDGVSSTLPSIVLSWNDQDNGQGQTLTMTATDTHDDLVHPQESTAFISASVSAPIAFSTTGYVSHTATKMKYAIHIRVEML